MTFRSSRSSISAALRQRARGDRRGREAGDDLIEIRAGQLGAIGLLGLLDQVGHAQQRVGRRRVLRIGRAHVRIGRQRGVHTALPIVDAPDEKARLPGVRARGPLAQRALQTCQRGVELSAGHRRQRRFHRLGDRVGLGAAAGGGAGAARGRSRRGARARCPASRRRVCAERPAGMPASPPPGPWPRADPSPGARSPVPGPARVPAALARARGRHGLARRQ